MFFFRLIRWEIGVGLSYEILFIGSEMIYNMVIIGGDYRFVLIRCKFYLILWFSYCFFLLESVLVWMKLSIYVVV